MTVRLLPCGPKAWLVEVSPDRVIGFAAAVQTRDDPSVVEVVPAAQTVLVRFTDEAGRDGAVEWLPDVRPERADHVATPEPVVLTVSYDGDDLAAVAAACAMTTDEVVERHTAATYRCAFCGFAPGFGYLTGLDPALHLPRRSTPRTRVPAGSVAIAAGYSAVYPSESPGGWHLLGRTDATLWDVDRDPPAAIVPGHAGAVHTGMTALDVVAAGWATSIQDAGRRGFADIGVPTSGALDAELRAVLNRLVGNPDDAAVLETLGGLRVEPSSAAVVATSAELAATAVPAGEVVEVEPAAGALWGYLAVRGGIDVDAVLGSRSQDSRSGLGPPAGHDRHHASRRVRPGDAARHRSRTAAAAP